MTFAMFGKFCITASFTIVYVYSAEIYPTVVRNIGVGTSSMCARIGSILAPFVRELGNATHAAVPLACFGGLSVASGLLVLLLPETNNCKVPDTIQEAARFGRKVKKNGPHGMENSNGYLAYNSHHGNDNNKHSKENLVNGMVDSSMEAGLLNKDKTDETVRKSSVVTRPVNIPENCDFPKRELSGSFFSGNKYNDVNPNNLL